MRVTLIRHGIAGDDADVDEERSLTKAGRVGVARVAQGLVDSGVIFDLIVSSPLVRAVQTAEIIAATWEYSRRVVVSRALIPEAPPTGVRNLLAGLGDLRSVALVAHEPVLSGMAAALLATPTHQPLRKAEALRIRLDGGLQNPGSLRWRIDPQTGKRKRF